MKVLVTGPFGNVGKHTVDELINQGHQVRCFATDRKPNRKAAKEYGGQIETVWGDIRFPADVAKAVQDQEAVVHLAYVIPSTTSTRGISSEDRPEWAWEVNVKGTKNVVDAARALTKPPSLIFASSTDIFGRTQDKEPPRTAADPAVSTSHYTEHKIICEEMVKESGLNWIILRLCAVPPLSMKLDPTGFDIPWDNRVEFVHPEDAGLACANSVACDEAIGKILLVGGGQRCQLYWRDFVFKIYKGLGTGVFPEKAFATVPYRQDWVDSRESQRLLRYQRRDLDDFIKDMKQALGFKLQLIRLFRPVVRWYVLRQSPYYRSG